MEAALDPMEFVVLYSTFVLETTVTTVDRNRPWGADIVTGVSEPRSFIIYR